MTNLTNPLAFSEALYEKMKSINAGIVELELYEFRYGLNDMTPVQGWESVRLEDPEEIEARVSQRQFYDRIQIKPRVAERIVLDAEIVRLSQMLFVGLVTGEFSSDWVRKHFYFDIRGFYFLHRTCYFTARVIAHFGGEPYQQFEPKQNQFERLQDLGYKAFKEANAEVDAFFITSVIKLIAARGTPILIAIAGPTAAGKTEIVERLSSAIEQTGRKVTSIELDNFLTDRDYREAQGIHSQGKDAIYFICLNRRWKTSPVGNGSASRADDFIFGTSSHDLQGRLKADGIPVEIEPADIIFIEGNFPFLLEEIAPLIGIKVVYLTDDPIRLKRKWKRER